MSFQILQYNLQKLVEQSNKTIAEIERKAGLKKNSVNNILKGTSKKPSAETLVAVAKFFSVDVQDFYDKTYFIVKSKNLCGEDYNLIRDITTLLVQEILKQNLEISFKNLIDLVYECFNYNKSSNLFKADELFIKWTLKQKIASLPELTEEDISKASTG